MRNPSIDDDTVDFHPKGESADPRTTGKMTVDETRIRRRQVEAVMRPCPLIERSEERDGVLTIHLSADGLARFKDPLLGTEEWKTQQQAAIATACEREAHTVVLALPENGQSFLGECVTGLLMALHKRVMQAHPGTRVVLRNAPAYFQERLRTHKFDRLLTIEEKPEQEGGTTN